MSGRSGLHAAVPAGETARSAGSVAWGRFTRAWAAARDYPTLLRLSREAEQLAAAPDVQSRLVTARIGVLSSATLSFVLPVLKAALLVAGVRPSFCTAPYGLVTSSLLDEEGPLAEFRPQVTIVFTATAHLPGWPGLRDDLVTVEKRVLEVCDAILGPCNVFHERTGSETIVHTFAAPPTRSAGSLGVRLPGDPTSFVRRVNLALADRAPDHVHVFDLAALAERVGLETWVDERYWYTAKQPFSFDCVGRYCQQLAALVSAILGRSKKCLVLDLDNTLWGGVIGDDGLGGIQIGEGSPEGEAFKAFQIYLRELQDRGVLLAVCSKNEDLVARLPFTDHPEMVLNLADFVAFRANWEPKSENLRALARDLDLPLEAFVFVDDNPAEREEIAQALPEVTVVDMPDEPAGFVRAIDRAQLFDAPRLTSEDVGRTAAYRARQQSLEMRSQATDVRAYLQSLEMRAAIAPFDTASLERITQLVNKTNQFNLTTTRVVLAEMRALMTDPDAVTLTVRLRDRLADHGLISVLYGAVREGQLTIAAWLMSCRVLGRGVEQLLFNRLLETARARGVEQIVGLYRPTDRNALVRDHYRSLGFSLDGEAEAGVERWRLDVATAAAAESTITLDDKP